MSLTIIHEPHFKPHYEPRNCENIEMFRHDILALLVTAQYAYVRKQWILSESHGIHEFRLFYSCEKCSRY